MHLPLKSFHYRATVDADSSNDGELSVNAGPAGDDLGPYFAGLTPRLRFREDRVVLVTDPPGGSPFKWCAFPAGDAIPIAARPGDVVEVRRNCGGGLVLTLSRDARLLVAVGELLAHDLETGPRLTRTDEPEVVATGRSTGRVLRLRESAQIDGYDVYVEAIRPLSQFGTSPVYLSVAAITDTTLVNAARRSATMMARQADYWLWGHLWGEAANGQMLRSVIDIDGVWQDANADR